MTICIPPFYPSRKVSSIHRRRRGGFTLIELLTVIAIIGILAAILIPVTGAMRERGRRAGCINNVRQQLLAMYLYAADNDGDGYWKVTTAGADDAPIYLYPKYVDDPDIFICPSTKNTVRKDWLALNPPVTWGLEAPARYGREDDRGGHSYEYFGKYTNGPLAGVDKSPNNIPEGWLAETVLMVDADNLAPNNCPAPGNNHGEDGWVWGFADGHAEFVTRADTNDRFERSFHTPTCP